MFTLATVASAEQEIKRSRFRAVAGPVADEAAARAFLAAHADATANHNCWAWRIGQAYRFSDDGEPSGTAGKPILAALDGQGLDRVAVIVTRWFGGTLLGSGGLMRAYGGTAALCLRGVEKLPLVPRIAATLACDFADLALLKARLAGIPDVLIMGETFTATGAVLDMMLPEAEIDSAQRLVADLTRGRSRIVVAG